MVCASVQGDNPRAITYLVDYPPVQTQMKNIGISIKDAIINVKGSRSRHSHALTYLCSIYIFIFDYCLNFK